MVQHALPSGIIFQYWPYGAAGSFKAWQGEPINGTYRRRHAAPVNVLDVRSLTRWLK
jgi:hypothetical protein